MSTKKVLLGIAAAAVIAIGYFALSGFPPVGPGAEGTVGAAKRYQSEQMASKDVVLQDTGVQQLLQSDTLRKLIADKETRSRSCRWPAISGYGNSVCGACATATPMSTCTRGLLLQFSWLNPRAASGWAITAPVKCGSPIRWEDVGPARG